MGLKRSKNITAARRTADKWFGKYIRIRDMDIDTKLIECITCGNKYKYRNGQINAGHWIESKVAQVRYNEWNVNGQCSGCNNYPNGLAAYHGKAIASKYGKEIPNELIELSKQDITYDKEDVMRIARAYKSKAEYLAKIKGVEL